MHVACACVCMCVCVHACAHVSQPSKDNVQRLVCSSSDEELQLQLAEVGEGSCCIIQQLNSVFHHSVVLSSGFLAFAIRKRTRNMVSVSIRVGICRRSLRTKDDGSANVYIYII